AGIALGAVLVAVALVAFEPWKLWVDKTVVEALPVAAFVVEQVPAEVTPTPTPQAEKPAAAEPTPKPTPTPPPAPAELFRGTFLSHEHGTTGTVRVLQLADGSRVLRLENLDTSNGPDLKVVLSDAPVLEGKAGWHVFDDNEHAKIGNLKGNKGSQNYEIPAGLDLTDLRSVSIWCDRFNVSFGAAALSPA
ncbi:MAG TPA: DM13 domain-containing protein, partial [Nonomuraea sp.]|nr:DM13 domain-containing protein [Nonomuraea sp.]